MVQQSTIVVVLVAASLVMSLTVSGVAMNVLANDNLEEVLPDVPHEIPKEAKELIGQIDTTAPTFDAPSNTSGISSFGTTDPAKFIAYGGRAAVNIQPDETNITSDPSSLPVLTLDIKRGSSAKLSLMASHYAGIEPVEEGLTVIGNGVSNGYVPAAAVGERTAEERTQELLETGKVTGELHLDSTVSFSPEHLTLKPNESASISLTISIPENWPDYVVGEKVWYSIEFRLQQAEDYSPTEVRVNHVPLWVHVTG